MNTNAQNPDLNALTEKADRLLQQMTLEEKASMCSGRDVWSTKASERLDLPSIWLADGPHGIRRAPTSDVAGFGDQLPAICFPTASALSATWDTELIEKVGQTLGKQSQSQGVHILLGPGVNIKRSVLGGRNFEYYSEDPLLSGEMGAAFIKGVQSQGVGTSLKHFTANNAETRRMHANSAVDRRTLHEIYLRPFEIAVKKSQPWTVMACYNRVQGVYGTHNPYLLTEILKEKWGFKGIVVSDWVSVVDRLAGVKAGMHLEMPFISPVNDNHVLLAVKNGDLKETTLDNLVKETLITILKAKSLENRNVKFDKETDHKFARYVSSQSITLLKNERQTLPVSADKYYKIAVIGEFATSPRYQGNGSSEVKPTQVDAALDIIRAEYGNQYEISFAQGYKLEDDDDFSLIEEAKNKAANADIALIFAGLPLHYEAEGIDRTHIDMPAAHNELIRAIASVQEKTVVVLTNGSAVSMPWIEDVDAIVESWLGGQAGAGGTADVLFGRINPSGKLAETFPKKLEDTPAYLNFPGEEGEIEYGERIFVGYRYYDKKKLEPLFPFGFGLSYTSFDYSDLNISQEQFTDKDKIKVSCKIRNTGDLKGKEVVQLYIGDLKSTLQRPEKELRKFVKIELEPGESRIVSFELEAMDFSYYDSRRDMWIAESGAFTIAVGASSRDIRLDQTVQLQSTQNIPLAFDEYTFFSEYWRNDQTRAFIVEMMPNWIRLFTPEGKSLDEAVFPDFYIDHPMIKYDNISGGEINKQQIFDLVKKCSTLTFTP